MDEVWLEKNLFLGTRVETENSVLLMIKAQRGFLGCGYFSLETADKLEECVAIVRKVRSYEDMLNTQVSSVSKKAGELGIQIGMKGSEALLLMKGLEN